MRSRPTKGQWERGGAGAMARPDGLGDVLWAAKSGAVVVALRPAPCSQASFEKVMVRVCVG